MAVSTKKQTRDDIEGMSQRERTWEALSSQYGKQKEQSNAQYDQAIQQQNNALLKRGMQRSSYGQQAVSGLRDAKIKAQNDIDSGMLGAYASALNDIENQEREQSNWERQFAEGQRQFNENLSETQKQNEWNRNFQESESAREQENWLKNYEEGRRQFDITSSETQKQNEWNRAFQESESERQQRNTEAELAQSQNQFAENMAYQRERAAVSDTQWERQFETANEQWKQQFEYTKMSDTQKLAYNYIVQAASMGNDVSDSLLKQAGLSRADYKAIKTQAAEITASSGGGGGGRYRAKNTGDNTGNETEGVQSWESFVGNTMNTSGQVSASAAGSLFAGATEASERFRNRNS